MHVIACLGFSSFAGAADLQPAFAGLQRSANWRNEPNISTTYSWPEALQPQFVYCQNKANTSIETYRKAIEYWNGKGYKLSTDIVTRDCENDQFDLGKIKLGGEEDMEQQFHGVTAREVQVDTEQADHKHVLFAYIKLKKDLAEDLHIVIHEVGHAIGLNHVDDRNAIMYRYHMDEETAL